MDIVLGIIFALFYFAFVIFKFIFIIVAIGVALNWIGKLLEL